MRMAMLSWTALNPTCKVKSTTKKYFNKYLFKAVLYLPGGRIIRKDDSSRLSINQLVELRKRVYESNKMGYFSPGWWSRSSTRHIADIKVLQLEYWHNVIRENNQNIKYRIEEPWMQLYCNDEQMLYDVVKGDPTSCIEFFKPESEETKQALEANELILRTPIDYNFRVYLKEGYKMNSNIRHSITQYLEGLGDDVKVTRSLWKSLETRLYFAGGYFYVKDVNVTTFLNLIAPGIIAGIFKLRFVPK